MYEVASRSVPAALAVVLLVAFTTGCSGDDDDATAPAVECTTLAPPQVVAATVEHGGTPLPAMGGAIQEGSYLLTAATAYLPEDSVVLPKCNGLADALVLSNGSFEHALGCYFDPDDPSTRLGKATSAGSYFVSDSAFSFNYTCPGARVETFSYSAEPPNLRMLVPDSSNTLTTELVWTLE